MITLVLGGARSGKSAVAERLVLAHPGDVLYVATGRADADDVDMAARIERHRHARDPRFTTIESAGLDGSLATTVAGAPAQPMLVDALGTWVAGQPEFSTGSGGGPGGGSDDGSDSGSDDWSDDWWDRQADALCRALRDRADAGAPTVLVSDEVGLGVHPESAVGRRFRDVLGLINQRVAAAADDVVLVVAGRVLHLEPEPEWVAPGGGPT